MLYKDAKPEYLGLSRWQTALFPSIPTRLDLSDS
jgi:hypothetical protein